MSTLGARETRGWPEAIAAGAEFRSAARLIGQLRACEAASCPIRSLFMMNPFIGESR